MFVITIVASRGNVTAWARRAAAPTAITSGSLRNMDMIDGANVKQINPAPIRKIVPYFTTKK